MERIYKIVDFAVPADHRIKLNECEKKDEYLDLARKKLKIENESLLKAVQRTNYMKTKINNARQNYTFKSSGD